MGLAGGRKVSATQQEHKVEKDMMTRVPIFPVVRTQRAMRYYDYGHEQTSTAASISSYVYSANGMFDPDITGSGHQPMGFDQLFLLYNQATVIRSRIVITAVCATNNPVRCALYASPIATPLSDRAQLLENGECQSRVVSGASTGAEHNVARLSMELDIAAYFGRKQRGDIVNDLTLTTLVNSNPTEQVYFIFASWANTNTTTSTIGFDVIIEYDAVFTEPKKLASS